jgi:glycosyltransferase involved in cell wall biosynthesis
MPLFTVVLTTYRRPDRLQDALSSIKAQTERDFEVIVMNNDRNSADKVELVVRSAGFPIKVVHNEENLGQSASRNRGVELARSELIALLDDDDTWLPTHLERHRAKHEADPDLSLVYCGHNVVWSDIPLATRPCPAPAPPKDLFHAMLCGRFTLASNSILTIKRDAYLGLGGYDASMSGFPDWDFQLRLSRTGKFGHIREPLVNFGFQLTGRDSDPDSRFAEFRTVERKWGMYPDVHQFIRKVRARDLFRASITDVYQGQRLQGVRHLIQYAASWGPGWDLALLTRLLILNTLGASTYTAIQRRANLAKADHLQVR